MDTNSQNHSLPLQLGVLEIKDQSNTQFRDAKVVQYQTTLMISDSIDHFCIHNHSVKDDQIRENNPTFTPL